MHMVVLAVCSVLAGCGIDPAKEMREAIQNGERTRAKDLLSRNPGVVNARDENDMTPLHWAALRCDREVCILMIEKGADINAIAPHDFKTDKWDNVDATPLDSAITNGRTEIIDLLRTYGAKTGEELKREQENKKTRK